MYLLYGNLIHQYFICTYRDRMYRYRSVRNHSFVATNTTCIFRSELYFFSYFFIKISFYKGLSEGAAPEACEVA